LPSTSFVFAPILVSQRTIHFVYFLVHPPHIIHQVPWNLVYSYITSPFGFKRRIVWLNNTDNILTSPGLATDQEAVLFVLGGAIQGLGMTGVGLKVSLPIPETTARHAGRSGG